MKTVEELMKDRTNFIHSSVDRWISEHEKEIEKRIVQFDRFGVEVTLRPPSSTLETGMPIPVFDALVQRLTDSGFKVSVSGDNKDPYARYLAVWAD